MGFLAALAGSTIKSLSFPGLPPHLYSSACVQPLWSLCGTCQNLLWHPLPSTRLAQAATPCRWHLGFAVAPAVALFHLAEPDVSCLTQLSQPLLARLSVAPLALPPPSDAPRWVTWEPLVSLARSGQPWDVRTWSTCATANHWDGRGTGKAAPAVTAWTNSGQRSGPGGVRTCARAEVSVTQQLLVGRQLSLIHI